jgi:hypothetical protein
VVHPRLIWLFLVAAEIASVTEEQQVIELGLHD